MAAGLVARFESMWPGLIVGVGIALLFLRPAVSVLRDAATELARTRGTTVTAAN
jgi:hypothetical protein